MTFYQLQSKNTARALAGACLVWLLSLPMTIPAYIATYLVLFLGVMPVVAGMNGNDGSGDAAMQETLNGVCQLIFVLVLFLSPLIVGLVAHRWIPRMLKAREPTSEERILLQSVENLAPAAGVSSPRLLVVDSPAINAALLGSTRAGWTMLMTTGSAQLSNVEREALVALALAGASNGGVTAGRLLIAATGPVLIAGRLIKALATPLRLFALWLASTVVQVAAAFAISDSTGSALALAFAFGTSLYFFVIPAMATWIALLAALQALGNPLVVKPSRLASDAAAVGLTRFPPPIRSLMVRARTTNTRPKMFPLGISSIWALPAGIPWGKEDRLMKRVRLLDKLDPLEAIRWRQ